MKTKFFKKSFTLFATVALLSSCLNKADQVEATHKSIELREDQVILMMSANHKTEASGVTAFWMPNSQGRPGVKIEDLPAEEQEAIKAVARVIVVNGNQIARLTTEAKRAGAFLQNPATKCVDLLTAYVGMQRCEAGKPAMEAGYAQIAANQAQLDAGYTQLESTRAQTLEQALGAEQLMDQIETQIEVLSADPQTNAAQIEELTLQLTTIKEGYKQLREALDVTIPAAQADLDNKQEQLNLALADLDGKKHQCEVLLPTLWAQNADFHHNLPRCAASKKTVDENVAAAEALGQEIAMTVGLENWLSGDAAKTSLVIKDNTVDMAVAFGHGADIIAYSTTDGSIVDASYNENDRELKFTIIEKDKDGNPTGAEIEVKLEKTAIDNVQKYTGHMKRFEGSHIVKQGKMSLTFDNE